MSDALPRRLLVVVAAIGAFAAAAMLWSAREDERRLADAMSAAATGEHRAALVAARDLQDGATIEGRAAKLAAASAFALGELDEGIRHLRRAARERPNDWRIHRDLAVALAFIGRTAPARAAAQRALRLNPRAVLSPHFNVRTPSR